MDLGDWLAAATSREVLVTEGKSGAVLERLVVGGDAYILKHIRAEDDWIMRVTGDEGTWFLALWSTNTLDGLPAVIDTAVVDVFAQPGGSAILMEDVGACLVPAGDAPLPVEQHRRFVDHVAALHAAYWGWEDDLGLLPLDRRYAWFAPEPMREEVARPQPAVVPGLAVQGWDQLPALAPRMAETLFGLHEAPAPFLAALAEGPQTLVHGDVKVGNLGSRPDGTTIMIDWALPGSAPPTYDLAHSLALNSARLPESKEAVIAAYRDALERHGVPTAGWFEDQVTLALLGHMLLLGWEKALGGPGSELDWWADAVDRAAALLG
jgi:Phosphotransferase enzyme family